MHLRKGINPRREYAAQIRNRLSPIVRPGCARGIRGASTLCVPNVHAKSAVQKRSPAGKWIAAGQLRQPPSAYQRGNTGCPPRLALAPEEATVALVQPIKQSNKRVVHSLTAGRSIYELASWLGARDAVGSPATDPPNRFPGIVAHRFSHASRVQRRLRPFVGSRLGANHTGIIKRLGLPRIRIPVGHSAQRLYLWGPRAV